MLNKILKYILPIIIVIMAFFMNVKEIQAVEKCTWYSYEAGIYYDKKTGTYKPVRTYSGNTLSYSLKFDKSYVRGNFKLTRLDKHFSDSVKQNELENSDKCPEYIGVQYNRKGKNDREVIGADSGDYTTYIKEQYDGIVINEDYNTVSYSGVLDSEIYMEANDKNNDEADPMYFTSVKTPYRTALKLDYLDEEVAENFYNALTSGKLIGFADKEKKEHTKEEFYKITSPIWSKAIDNMYSRLKTSCSGYTNKSSKHGDRVYLDLIDADVFPNLMSTNNVEGYDSTKYPTIPNETCFNTIYEAKFMQASFIDWFKLVDWLSLTKADNASNFDQFFKYYEFAHLQSNGGDYVSKIREILTAREEGNKSYDNYNYWATSSKRCEALCEDLKNQNSYSYDQCLIGSTVNVCKSYEEECQDKCVGVTGDNGACVEVCFKEKLDNSYGTGTYDKMKENYNKIQTENKENITESLEEMKDTLSKIDVPTLDGVKFEPYKAKCEDVVIFHTIYKIMTIMAPILVIVFGSLDYAKAVMASDEKKMEESKKKFPKRLLLLVLFVAIPTIISIILSFSNGETTLMHCVINGA